MSNSDSTDTLSGRLPWELTLGEFLDGAVNRSPEKVFVEISGRSITYSQLQQAAMKTAGMFQAMGVGKGDLNLMLEEARWQGLFLINTRDQIVR